MDEVQTFITRNKHQYGYIMQEASRQWIKENPTGALTVGPCNIFVEKYGDYHVLQDKNEDLEKQIEQLKENFKSEATCQEYWKEKSEKQEKILSEILEIVEYDEYSKDDILVMIKNKAIDLSRGFYEVRKLW